MKLPRAPEIVSRMYSFIVFASAIGKSGDTASARRSLMVASSRFEAVMKIGDWPNKRLAASAVYTSSGGGAAEIRFTLPAGLYRAVLASKDKNGASAKTDALFTVCDTSAKNFNIKMPAFFVYESLKVNTGGVFRAVWGSGYENTRVFVEIMADGRHLKKYWSPAGSTQHLIEVPVTDEFRGKGFCVITTFVRNNRVYANIARVSVPWSGGPLAIKINDFRSKLNPGGREKISISVRGADGRPKKAELAASLYDESLDAYKRLEWPDLGDIFYSNNTAVGFTFSNSFYLYGVLSRIKPSDLKGEQKVFHEYYDLPYEIDNGYFGSGIESRSRMGDSQYEYLKGPEPLEEGQPFLDGEPSLQKYRRMSYKGVIEFMNRYKGGFRYACIDDQNNPPAKNNLDLSKVMVRKNLSESGCFFADAVTGDDGVAVLEFTMPDTLAKWRFLVFAHDAALENGCKEEFFLSSRELMVRPCSPRFIMADIRV